MVIVEPSILFDSTIKVHEFLEANKFGYKARVRYSKECEPKPWLAKLAHWKVRIPDYQTLTCVDPDHTRPIATPNASFLRTHLQSREHHAPSTLTTPTVCPTFAKSLRMHDICSSAEA